MGRAVFFLVLAVSLFLVGLAASGAAQLSAQADASAVTADSTASLLVEAESEAKGAQDRRDVAWEELQYDQQNASQIYDLSVARGVKDGSIPAPKWPATFGYDAALKAEMDAAIAAAAAEYSPTVEALEEATARVKDATAVNEDALVAAVSDRASADDAWAGVAVAIAIGAAAVVLAGGLWFMLSSALIRARATVALSGRSAAQS